MEQKQQDIGGRMCRLYRNGEPQAILLHVLHARHPDELEATIEQLVADDRQFALLAIPIEDWELELMPWAEPVVSRRPEVGTGAEETLSYIIDTLLHTLDKDAVYANPSPLPIVFGGYSLGGLFALWASCRTDRFAAVAAGSPSLWAGPWPQYADGNPTRATYVYLSLGESEGHTKNKTMATCADRVRDEHSRLVHQLGKNNTTLVWEQGGHFTDPGGRMARAYAWCLDRVEK